MLLESLIRDRFTHVCVRPHTACSLQSVYEIVRKTATLV